MNELLKHKPKWYIFACDATFLGERGERIILFKNNIYTLEK